MLLLVLIEAGACGLKTKARKNERTPNSAKQQLRIVINARTGHGEALGPALEVDLAQALLLLGLPLQHRDDGVDCVALFIGETG